MTPEGAQPPQPPPQSKPLLAALWMMVALASFSLMAVGGREISKELDTFQLMFFRGLFGLILVLIFASFTRRGFAQFRTTKFKLHVVRNLVHYVGQFGWFMAVALIPLAQVFAIEFTTPLWVALLAPLILGERLTKGRILSVLIGFAGILVVVQPWQNSLEPGAIAVVIAAIAFALSLITTKRLTGTDSPLAIVFYMSIIQAPISAVPAFFGWVTPSAETLGWLFLISFCGMSAHYSIARAFVHADAIVVVPMDFLRLPLISIVGYLVYSEGITLGVVVGGCMILLANWLNLWREARPQRPAVEPP